MTLFAVMRSAATWDVFNFCVYQTLKWVNPSRLWTSLTFPLTKTEPWHPSSAKARCVFENFKSSVYVFMCLSKRSWSFFISEWSTFYASRNKLFVMKLTIQLLWMKKATF